MTCAVETWTNWERNQRCRAEVCRAGTLEELQSLVARAKREGKTIRVAGGGGRGSYSGSFSGSPVVTNEGGILVTLAAMNRGRVHADGSRRITAEAGMTLGELEKLARSHRLSFPTIPVPEFIQVGGAVALGCHGCGRHGGSFSDCVVAMDILAHDGSVRTVTQENEPELLRAARVNLGALGIILKVTFQCVEEFKLRAVDAKVNMAATLADIAALVEGHDYVELFWYPFNEDLWLKTWDRVPVETPNVRAPGPWDRFLQWLQATAGGLFLAPLVWLPRLTPLVTRTLMRLTATGTVVAPAALVYHYQNYFPRKLMDLSYELDVGDGFERFREAWTCVTDKVTAYRRAGKFPQNFAMHVRFFKSTDAYLDPSAGNRLTAVFEVITWVGSDHYEQFYQEIEACWLTLGARPHWGKIFDPGQDFAKLYGDNLEKFNQVRREMDPGGLFLNEFTRHVFGVSKTRMP